MEGINSEFLDSNSNTIKVKSVQDNVDLVGLKMTTSIAVTAMNCCYKTIAKTITNEKKLDCKLLAEKITDFLKDMRSHSLIFSQSLPENMCFGYDPIFDGGYNYELNLKKVDDRSDFVFDTIHCSIGIVYKGFPCEYARTVLVNPTTEVKQHYIFVLSILNKIIDTLRPGVSLKFIYKSAFDFAFEKNATLAGLLRKELGYGLGFDFKDQSMIIDSSSTGLAQEHAIFSIKIALEGFEVNGNKHSIINSDTVIVRKDAPAKLLTTFKQKYHNFIVNKR